MKALVMAGIAAAGVTMMSGTVFAQEGDLVNVFKMKAGECYNGELNGDPMPRAACEGSKMFELYSVYKVEGKEYPGDEAMEAEAERGCVKAFEEYVGIPFESSEFAFDYLTPSQGSWTMKKDREVMCFITTVADEPFEGVAKGSKR